MPFKITQTQVSTFPNTNSVESFLSEHGLTLFAIKSIIDNYVCMDKLFDGYGYQQSIAGGLEYHLKSELKTKHNLVDAGNEYSDNLNEVADLCLKRNESNKRIYFELEFRPNVEKDLIKFHIGHNTGKLGIGILIVAIDRNSINANYTTMPEYHKVIKIVSELNPKFPVVVLGIDGAHIDM